MGKRYLDPRIIERALDGANSRVRAFVPVPGLHPDHQRIGRAGCSGSLTAYHIFGAHNPVESLLVDKAEFEARFLERLTVLVRMFGDLCSIVIGRSRAQAP